MTLRAQLARLRQRNRFPTSPQGFLGTHGALSAAALPPERYCVRIAFMDTDDGLDSNGYYQGFIESAVYPPMAAYAPEVRVLSDVGYPLRPGGRILAYPFRTTTGASDSADDGFWLMRPIVSEGGAVLSCGFFTGGFTPGFKAIAVPGPTAIQWSYVGSSTGNWSTSDSGETFEIPDDGAYLVHVDLLLKQNWSGTVTSAEPDAFDCTLGSTGTCNSIIGPDVSVSAWGPVRVGYFAVPTYSAVTTLTNPGTTDESASTTLTPTWNYEDMGPRSLSATMLIRPEQQGETFGFNLGGSVVNGSADSVLALGLLRVVRALMDN